MAHRQRGASLGAAARERLHRAGTVRVRGKRAAGLRQPPQPQQRMADIIRRSVQPMVRASHLSGQAVVAVPLTEAERTGDRDRSQSQGGGADRRLPCRSTRTACQPRPAIIRLPCAALPEIAEGDVASSARRKGGWPFRPPAPFAASPRPVRGMRPIGRPHPIVTLRTPVVARATCWAQSARSTESGSPGWRYRRRCTRC